MNKKKNTGGECPRNKCWTREPWMDGPEIINCPCGRSYNKIDFEDLKYGKGEKPKWTGSDMLDSLTPPEMIALTFLLKKIKDNITQ